MAPLQLLQNQKYRNCCHSYLISKFDGTKIAIDLFRKSQYRNAYLGYIYGTIRQLE